MTILNAAKAISLKSIDELVGLGPLFQEKRQNCPLMGFYVNLIYLGMQLHLGHEVQEFFAKNRFINQYKYCDSEACG